LFDDLNRLLETDATKLPLERQREIESQVDDHKWELESKGNSTSTLIEEHMPETLLEFQKQSILSVSVLFSLEIRSRRAGLL
jgi:hypothetical protein